MKNYSRRVISISLLVLSICFLPKSTNALGNPGDDPDIPIDGGVSLLVAAGVAYGIKKIRDERKKNADKLR